LRVRAARNSTTRIKKEIERLEKLGFRRGGSASKSPKDKAPTSEEPPAPKAHQKPRPGGSGTPPADEGKNPIFNTLGY